MIKALLFDFSRTLLFPKDLNYSGGLNSLYKEVSIKENFRVFDYFDINQQLLDSVNYLKDKYPSYIFTTDSIQEDQAIQDKIKGSFLKIFSAKAIGLEKTNKDSYQFILNEIGFEASEVLFIDDSQDNINTADAVGIKTIKYIDFEDLQQKAKQFGVEF